MSNLQIALIALFAPLAFIVFVVVLHLLPRLHPAYRLVYVRTADVIPRLTGRPLRKLGPFTSIEIVGTDRDRVYLRATFADTRTFGTDVGPPRAYFVYSRSDDAFNAVTASEVRPYKHRSSWC
jgi:hypothetical protein